MSLFIKNIFLVQLCLILAILYPTSLANLVVEVGTRHSHQTLFIHTFSCATKIVSVFPHFRVPQSCQRSRFHWWVYLKTNRIFSQIHIYVLTMQWQHSNGFVLLLATGRDNGCSLEAWREHRVWLEVSPHNGRHPSLEGPQPRRQETITEGNALSPQHWTIRSGFHYYFGYNI